MERSSWPMTVVHSLPRLCANTLLEPSSRMSTAISIHVSILSEYWNKQGLRQSSSLLTPWATLSFLVLVLAIGPEAVAQDSNSTGPCAGVSKALNSYVGDHESWLREKGLLEDDTIIGIVAPQDRVPFPEIDTRTDSCDAPQIAILVEEALSKKYMAFSDLRKVALPGVDFGEVLSMRYAWLNHAQLQGSRFVGVDLENADLSDADLQLANLSQANFTRAKLIRADLNETIVGRTKFSFANVQDATYSPKPISPPSNEVVGMLFVNTVKFGTMQESGMAQLRKIFKELHLRDLEQDATFAMRSHSASFFEFLAFEIPVSWGRRPGRALKIMLGIFFLCSLYYGIVIKVQNGRPSDCRKSCVLLARLPGHLTRENSNFMIKKESCIEVLKTTGVGIFGWSIWFSALSAFHIGWRDLNFGTWLTRIQPEEFVLRGYGALRVVSGVQSLLSVYLLAIWAVTTFGRPFE